jgi:hypothetical protein
MHALVYGLFTTEYKIENIFITEGDTRTAAESEMREKWLSPVAFLYL